MCKLKYPGFRLVWSITHLHPITRGGRRGERRLDSECYNVGWWRLVLLRKCWVFSDWLLPFRNLKKFNSEILVWHFRIKLAMILQWNTLVFPRKILIWTCSEPGRSWLWPVPDNEKPRFHHDAKGVIWVTIYIHIYKLRFTPAYNFYQPELDRVLNNQDNHLLPLFFPFSFSSKLINRIKRGTIPSSKINKQVRNIHQALENQKLVIEGARNIGCEIPNISAEDLWSRRVR